MADRCRLCTTNDVDGLIDEMAAAPWERSRDPAMDPPWANAGEFWQSKLRIHAQTMIGLLHPHR